MIAPSFRLSNIMLVGEKLTSFQPYVRYCHKCGIIAFGIPSATICTDGSAGHLKNKKTIRMSQLCKNCTSKTGLSSYAGILNAKVPHMWQYLRYWWNEVNVSSTRITFDRVYDEVCTNIKSCHNSRPSHLHCTSYNPSSSSDHSYFTM